MEHLIASNNDNHTHFTTYQHFPPNLQNTNTVDGGAAGCSATIMDDKGVEEKKLKRNKREGCRKKEKCYSGVEWRR